MVGSFTGVGVGTHPLQRGCRRKSVVDVINAVDKGM